ncbi:MAG TPA: hypothetical protein VL068_10130 [Microthrixaceae bacterium]|nr:hypothetical protein [Microthrixaceae bacterium]
MATFRDRFLTPKVARAITSPSAIIAAGAGASLGILVTSNPIGIVALAVAAFSARVLAAVPRSPQRPKVEAKGLDEPWRSLLEEVIDAGHRFDRALSGIVPGPLKDRLTLMGERLRTGIDEASRIAHAGNQLSSGRKQIDTARIRSELAVASSGTKTPRSEQTINAIKSQLSSAERLDATIAETLDKLRLLDARIDETVTRAIELSVSQSDTDDLGSLGGLGSEVESIVNDMEALRQAVEETNSPGTHQSQATSRPQTSNGPV